MAHEFFKNTTIVIDSFHYMEHLTEAVQNIRREI
ncbi:MAG: transposase [Bacilli bacterium]